MHFLNAFFKSLKIVLNSPNRIDLTTKASVSYFHKHAITSYIPKNVAIELIFIFKSFIIYSEKRAAFKYAKERASIASRWGWLMTQISELDYRIRQHMNLQDELRAKKGPVLLENDPQPVNGLRGQLPETSTSSASVPSLKTSLDVPPNGALDASSLVGSARTRAFDRSLFQKRRLVQTAQLHTISKRAARPR